jgi:predicted enzyme related to lactoylglutathione lyase
VKVSRPFSVVIDCSDPKALAQFWAPALGYKDSGWPHEPYVVLIGDKETKGPLLLLQRVDEPKQGKNRVHLDLYADDMEAEADRLTELGATRMSDPIDENGARWIRMADPEGNEFCISRGAS